MYLGCSVNIVVKVWVIIVVFIFELKFFELFVIVFMEIVKGGMVDVLKVIDFEIRGDVIRKWFLDFYVVRGYKVLLSLFLVFDDLIVLLIIVGML